jgi:hypothetical protein
MYIALIGDMINSRKLNNRMEVQNRLQTLLSDINGMYSEDIESNFLITLGDEFQGLLKSPNHILSIIDYLQFKLHPIKIRFGIGIGTITTKINKSMALGADGPAYHYARDMINQIKTIENSKLSGSNNIMFYSDNQSNIFKLINTNLQLCTLIENTWTEKQRVLLEKILLENKNQTEAAKELHITQSSVQRRLKASGYFDYIRAKETITSILNEIWGG